MHALLSVAEDAGNGGQRERWGGRGSVIGAMLRGVCGVQHGAVLGGDELHGLMGAVLTRESLCLASAPRC